MITVASLIADVMIALAVIENEHKLNSPRGSGGHPENLLECAACRAIYNANEALSMLPEGIDEREMKIARAVAADYGKIHPGAPGEDYLRALIRKALMNQGPSSSALPTSEERRTPGP